MDKDLIKKRTSISILKELARDNTRVATKTMIAWMIRVIEDHQDMLQRDLKVLTHMHQVPHIDTTHILLKDTMHKVHIVVNSGRDLNNMHIIKTTTSPMTPPI